MKTGWIFLLDLLLDGVMVTLALRLGGLKASVWKIGLAALAGAAAGIGLLMNRRGIYFVPFEQDDHRAKPTSCVADFTQILPAAEAALEGRQMQPMIF